MTRVASPALALAHGAGDWLASLSDAELHVLPWVYEAWLRPEQLLPTHHWRTCGLGAGRGWGKGLAVAREINRRVEAGEEKHIMLMAPTEDRVIDVQIRPLIDYAPPWFRPEITRRGIRWPNGVEALTFTPLAPGRPRGENASLSWCTELVDWKATTRLEAWDNLATATRIGRQQIIWDSTSKGRNDLLGSLYAANVRNPTLNPIIGGTMFDNPLLSVQYMRAEYERYTGIRRQEELFGERFDEAAGALWRQEWLDRTRVDVAPECEWQIVSVDPALSTVDGSDKTGIVVAGRARGDGHVYVLADLTDTLSPDQWGDIVVAQADPRKGAGRGRVSVERNHLGDNAVFVIRSRAENVGLLVKTLAKDEPWPAIDPRCIHVREHISRDSKGDRAVGPAAETEAGRVHLVGEFAELETQLTAWVPGEGRSPNNLDAFAYAVIELRELDVAPKVDRRQDSRTAAAVHRKLTSALAGRRPGRLGL